MSRLIHRWPGLIAGLLLLVLSLSGAALSIFPAVERLSSPQATAAVSVADVAGRSPTARPREAPTKRAARKAND